MNMTEKNGQPSMEEILASIRRIIAEEPANQTSGELRGTPIMLKGDGVLDDASDFDLPAIFRSSPPPASDRQTPLLGRLTDAIRSATSAQPEAPRANGEAVHAEPAEARGETAEPSHAYPALSSLKPVRAEPQGEHMNGTHLVPAPQPAPTASPSPFPTPMTVSREEPRRVMAPFKDTHFLRMSAPTGAAASPMPASEPPAAVPAPPAAEPAPPAPEPVHPVDFSAIVPAQFDRSSFANGASPAPRIGATPAEWPSPAQPAGPTVVPMPPPPLPVAEPAHTMLPVPAHGATEGTGSIEDTTADLLRPMLRQWLADNMPRMVEKALHIEIAESVKVPRKP